MNKLDRYVGIPYIDRGRNIFGVDCYGLVFLVYKNVLGIELPSYDTRYVTSVDRAATAALINGELDPWEKIEKGFEKAFDVVLIRIGRDIMHIGLVVDSGRVLHVERGDLSKIESYRSGRMKHRIADFYRYRGN